MRGKPIARFFSGNSPFKALNSSRVISRLQRVYLSSRLNSLQVCAGPSTCFLARSLFAGLLALSMDCFFLSCTVVAPVWFYFFPFSFSFLFFLLFLLFFYRVSLFFFIVINSVFFCFSLVFFVFISFFAILRVFVSFFIRLFFFVSLFLSPLFIFFNTY